MRRLVQRSSHVNWALSDQALVSGCNFATNVLVARNLGIAEFGRFALAWMVVLFVASLAHAAINAPMMSIGPKQPAAAAAEYYGAVILQQGLFAAISFLVVYGGTLGAAAWFPTWQLDGLALPLAVATAFWQIQDFVRRYFFTRGQALQAVINDTISYGGQLAALICLFHVTGAATSSVTVIWVVAVTCGLASLHGALATKPLARARGAVLREVAVRHWRFARWLIASAALVWPSGNLFFVVAGAVLGPAAVGALKAAQNLMGVTHILFQGLENVAPIAAARHLTKAGTVGMIRYLWRVACWGGLATLATVLVIVLAPEFWIRLLLGAEYTRQAGLLLWFGALYLLLFGGIALRLALRTFERTRPIFVSYVFASVFSSLAAYPMTQAYGMSGLMVCWLATQGILQLALWRGLLHSKNLALAT